MNETEKRRQQLLHQARELYRDVGEEKREGIYCSNVVYAHFLYKGGTSMNETEKRRQQLLHQARELYRDVGETIPAIHPRYRAAYESIYGTDKEEVIQSTFGIRVVICVMIFAVFVLTDYKGTTI